MAEGSPRFLHAGETAVVVEYGTTTGRAHHDRVLALDAALAAAPIPGVTETVPTYRSLMIHFDARALTPDGLVAALRAMEPGAARDQPPGRRWRVPACYDGPHGEDLAEVAALLGMTPERVAALHAGARYRVVMYGFAPGFVFIDGLPDALRVSRRQTPRAPHQPGALPTANGQALIASVSMPTGWYVLGRTPWKTYDPRRAEPFPLAVGDEVTFERVDPARFDVLAREAEAGAPLVPVEG